MSSSSGNFPALRAVAEPPDTETQTPERSESVVPNTGPQRVDRRDSSGSLAADSDRPVQAALAASTHIEANLSGLLRAVQHLSVGVSRAREANDALTTEIESLRGILESADEREADLKHRVATLELALDRAQVETFRERVFLFEQQDAFISALVDDQERELARREATTELLKNRVTELEMLRSSELSEPTPPLEVRGLAPGSSTSGFSAAPGTEETSVNRAMRERDEAVWQVHQLKIELEQARAHLRSGEHVTGNRTTAPPALELDQIEQEQLAKALTQPPPQILARVAVKAVAFSEEEDTDPGIGPPSDRRELEHSPATPTSTPVASQAPISPATSTPIAAPPSSAEPPTSSPSATSIPSLKQKPDVSTRPLIGYSLGPDSVEPEHIGPGLVPRPPR